MWRDQVSEEVTAVGERLGRVVRSAVQDEQRGTGDAVRCGLAALPAGLTGAARAVPVADELDEDRAESVLPVLATLLGVGA